MVVKWVFMSILVSAAIGIVQPNAHSQQTPNSWHVDTTADTPYIGDKQTIVDNTDGTATIEVTITRGNDAGQVGNVHVDVVRDGDAPEVLAPGNSITVAVPVGKKLQVSVTGSGNAGSGTFTTS